MQRTGPGSNWRHQEIPWLQADPKTLCFPRHILRFYHDLADQQTTVAVALNIAWQDALGIRHEPDAYLCERTLRNYRRRILEPGFDEVIFRTLTDQLIQAVGVETTKQRLDSTAVKSAIRGLTR